MSSDVVGRESVAHMLFALLDDHPDAIMMWNGTWVGGHSPHLVFSDPITSILYDDDVYHTIPIIRTHLLL